MQQPNNLRTRTTAMVKRQMLAAPQRLGAWPHLRRLAGESLVGLLYHRIDDPDRPEFYGFRENVSATREAFAAQLDYLVKNYDVVTLDDCIAWIEGRAPLSSRAVLITFDDGYRDNFVNAAPELNARNLRAVLFAATGFMNDEAVFYWDWVAEAFRWTSQKEAELPLLSHTVFDNPQLRQRVAQRWITTAKALLDEEKRQRINNLADCLQVLPPHGPPPGLHMSWPEIGTSARDCFDIGAHTVNHPIVSRLSIDEAEREISKSKTTLENVLGHPVRAFAYPNGQPGDFGPEHEAILEKLGFSIGFAAHGGLTFAADARKRRFALRRACVNFHDDLPRLAAKVAGATRFLDS
jgi:peptidoglycan/xylan/chitin deacetylase (PgdA/CDA1 family)